MQHDALVEQTLAHYVDRVLVVFAHDREALDHGHLDTETPVGLSHFDADRTAADHDQVLGLFGQFEDILIREIGYLVDAGDRRHEGRGPCRDDKAASLDAVAAGLDFASVDELGRSLDHLDAEAFEALNRVMRRNTGNHVVHMRVDLREVDFGFMAVDAELARTADGFGGLAGGDQGLGGDTTGVEAIAAHLGLFDKHHLGAHLRGTRRHAQPAGTGADDRDINIECLLVGHVIA